MDLGIKGKTALVTGSDRNTGQIIASALLDAGAQVIIHSNDLNGVAAEAASSIGAAHSVEGDLAQEPGCAAVLEQLTSQNLDVDILVNNYGTASYGKWDSTDTADWLDMYQKNVLSVARLVQGLVPEMKTRGWGRIVNLGTIGSHRPGNRMPHYYASKGALANLGVSLCQELADTGITVNTVSPGLIRTPDLEAGYRARAAKKGWGESWDEIQQRIVAEDFPNPCGRLATREEVADLVAFLCSARACFINCQNIRIDGGSIAYV
jgi:3-oxoacyl-[acyl-carrier protein] reductase